MKQFVWITGAGTQETPWFSRACDTLAGKIGHTASDTQPASPCGVEGLNRTQGTLCGLLLAWFSGLTRHFDPVYESMT